MMGSRGEAAMLQQHGQNLYRQGNLEGALDAFTEALKCPDVDVLAVLDNRAATYTKLLRYDQALKDSRRMIKQDKQDDRGYLRCAKALILDGKPKKALDVYAYALKSLPRNHARLQIVEQLHKKLRDTLVCKHLDPFTVLPFEIAEMVLQYFDFKHIVRMLRVSKGWERFLSSKRDLWMHIDLSGARRKNIHWTSVRSYIQRSKAMLTHAIVKNLSSSSIYKSLEFFSRCPNLEHLELGCAITPDAFYQLFRSSKKLKVLLISADSAIPQSITAKILSSLPNLERLEIHKSLSSPSHAVQWPPALPNLRSITLGTTENTPQRENLVPPLYIPRRQRENESAFPFPISNLTEIRLQSNPNFLLAYPLSFNPLDLHHLQRLDISGLYIDNNYFGLPPSLQYLRIRGGAAAEAVPFYIHTTNNSDSLHLPNLHTLILSDIPWATNETLLAFLTDKSPIEVLHIDRCFRLDIPAITPTLCDFATNLTTLNLSYHSSVTDSIIEAIVQHIRTLKVLNLSYTQVTGVTIRLLVKVNELTNTQDEAHENTSTKVDCLYVVGCERVSSDAIAYGKANGIYIYN